MRSTILSYFFLAMCCDFASKVFLNSAFGATATKGQG